MQNREMQNKNVQNKKCLVDKWSKKVGRSISYGQCSYLLQQVWDSNGLQGTWEFETLKLGKEGIGVIQLSSWTRKVELV